MPNPPNHSPSNWFSANLKWLLPLGCLAFIGIVLAFVASILVIVFSSMKSSWAYEEGMQLALAHPDVIEHLGEPITSGLFMTGSINVSNASGNADLSISLRGPQGRGTLYVVAERSEGEWSMRRARFRPKDQDVLIDLLDQDPNGDGPLPLEADDPS